MNGLGTVKSVPMPASERQDIAMGGVDELGGPFPYTLTLSRRIDVGDTPVNCDVRAFIAIGAGGGTRQFVTDWNPGTQINLAGAGSVRVTAVTYAPDPNNPYSAGNATVELTTSLAMLAGPHPRPRYTQRLPTLDVGQNSDIIVPPLMAHAVQPKVVPADPDDLSIPCLNALTIRWIAPDDSIIVEVPASEWSSYHYLPIPASSRAQVHNACNIALNPTLLWELAA